MVKIIPNIGFPYTYKDKPIIIEFNDEISVHYKINLVNKTVNFVNGSIKKTYEIQKVIYKSGVIKKILTFIEGFYILNLCGDCSDILTKYCTVISSIYPCS